MVPTPYPDRRLDFTGTMPNDHSGEADRRTVVHEEEEPETEHPLDRLYGVLTAERRRRLLFYLHRKDGDVASCTELVDYLVVDEAESVADLDTDEVAISLYHTHLPKLADAGLIEYDERSRTVRYHGDDTVGEHLGVLADTNGE